MTAEDKSQIAEDSVGQEESQAAAQDTAKVAQPADTAALQQEVEKQKELARRHLDGWKRAAADLENYRKRVEKEQAELVKFGHAALISRLLPVLDDLERAFQTLPAELGHFTWVEGLVLIERKMRLVLESQGLAEIEAVGKPFDPSVHEAVLQEQSAKHADGQVMAVLQRGYMLHERLLRPAIVKVARNPQDNEEPQADQSASNESIEDRKEE